MTTEAGFSSIDHTRDTLEKIFTNTTMSRDAIAHAVDVATRGLADAIGNYDETSMNHIVNRLVNTCIIESVGYLIKTPNVQWDDPTILHEQYKTCVQREVQEMYIFAKELKAKLQLDELASQLDISAEESGNE